MGKYPGFGIYFISPSYALKDLVLLRLLKGKRFQRYSI